ncbi:MULTISPECIES: helix-turn-helix domain-containing protein [Bacillus]|nr:MULTISPECIES: helix-turn-helix transcriptional regulator [Bacillus]KKB75310.1 XRE family transcriptional regulator [Bacillus sp. TH008]MBU8785587.1 helix-turn-helix domain-containing protein [Bacillus glycinifermentans]MDU0070712.1 helix-turn-helix transcriptional regulator [Bacillus sp. IG6]MED8018576.1 helix-turn-helix transcriptional regulator [Bacillus glycinifermentans]WKB76737.1 helix-turn-helix transcriptional regulator [Bacillus glycinifermentans]
MTTFGEQLKKLREQRKLSVNQLAMYAGVSAAAISRIENGHRGVPKPATIKKLAEALKIPYEQLMDIAGYMSAGEIREKPPGYRTICDIADELDAEDLWLFDAEKWDCLSREDILHLEQYFHFLVAEAKKRKQ